MTSSTAPSVYREFTEPVPDLSEIGECGDPVGVLEMAERLGIQDRSVHMIRRRGQLPPPDYEQVNGSRAWEWSTILWWAGETDRLRTHKLLWEYRDMFGMDPPSSQGRVPAGVHPHGDTVDAAVPLTPSLPDDELATRRA